MHDPYQSLGVPPDATPKEIDTAFRKQSLRHHPDHGGDTDRFKEVRESYELLKDQDRREHYDRTGRDRPENNRVKQFVEAMVEDAFTQHSQDAFAFMRQHVRTNRRRSVDNKSKSEKAIKALTDRLQEFQKQNENSPNKEGAEFIEQVVVDRIAAHQRSIEIAENEMQFADAVLDFIKELKLTPGVYHVHGYVKITTFH